MKNSFTLAICVSICTFAIIAATTPETTEDAEPPGVYDFQKYFFTPRSGRSLDASPKGGFPGHGFVAPHNESDSGEDGRLFPGAPSFLARLAFRVLLWKILRAAAQYFVDLLVGEMFG